MKLLNVRNKTKSRNSFDEEETAYNINCVKKQVFLSTFLNINFLGKTLCFLILQIQYTILTAFCTPQLQL